MDINKFLNISGAIVFAIAIGLVVAVPWLFILGIVGYFMIKELRNDKV